MAYGNGRREAYTVGGEASLLSLDILNVGAFIFQTVGAVPEAPRWRGATDRPGSETDAKPRDGSPGNLGDPAFARRERAACPGRRGGPKLLARRRACIGVGSASATYEPPTGTCGTGWRINKPKDTRGQEVVAPS